ncbi:hypothetical protein WG908_09510 [Sphingobium sp. AN641]|uniref:hypothetical protein n=1 Tax=Sphingobium sp. AN641 TaxID=3133443 RepID=UPI0030BD9C7D
MAIFLLVAPAPAAPAAEPSPYPRRTLILFVAAWCAPCHAEIARIDEIMRVAQPYGVKVVPMDSGRRGEAMLRRVPTAVLWRPTPGQLLAITTDLARRTTGLPFSIMTDDGAVLCASSKAGVDGHVVRAMQAQCRPAAIIMQ